MSLVRKSSRLATSMILLGAALLTQPLQAAPDTGNAVTMHPYWQERGAEISVYELSQHRYRDIHKGQLITVVVKEDFLTEKQVKNERYVDKKSTGILKRIELRKYATGVYDYSTFSSVFTPTDRENFSHSLKVTSSVQEWCGVRFMQMNWKNNAYIGQQNSYFEQEGDKSLSLGNAVLEDELYNTIRMNPRFLPLGEFKIIPSLVVLQTQHHQARSYKAQATLADYKGSEFVGKNLMVYQVKQPEITRTLEIVFERAGPFKIVGWTDSYPSVSDKKVRSTVAKLTAQKKLEYWNQQSLEDRKVRGELGIRN